MSLYEKWNEVAGEKRTQAESDEFWSTYFEKEKNNYQCLLENYKDTVKGKLSEVAARFEMDDVTFTGFLDGINTSLVEPIELKDLDENSDIELNIDFEKLYFNMLEAKADWLYNLPQWEDVLSDDKRQEITKEFRVSKIAVSNKVGRNDPCTCGSGKKHKKCCGK